MKKMILLVALFVMSGVGASWAFVNDFQESRQYEPRVIRGSHFGDFLGQPIKDIYLYAYDENSNSMKIIPFQFDERVVAPDPISPSKERASYFIKDDELLDIEDELVFMLRDLGPKAPAHIWIDDALALSRTRIEIEVYDRNDTQKENALYAYLFHSNTITDEIPKPYNFAYDPVVDRVSCTNYSIGFGRPGGLISDIILYPPLGTGVDIFDSMKLRVVGVIDLGLINIAPGKNGEDAMNERDNFYIFPFEGDIEDGAYLGYTQEPVVRLIREVHQTLRVGTINLPNVDFFVQTAFYPYSGFNSQGANLNPDSLRDQFPDADDIFMEFDLVRQSWDYNENAVGMKFYSRNNDGVLMDGIPDTGVNRTLANRTWGDNAGISDWAMASGDQGTVFTHLQIPDVSHEKIELYYHDDKNGGQDDDSLIKTGDTADGMSYGDQGIKIINTKNLELKFIAYFVDGNKDKAFGDMMADNYENGVWYTQRSISFPTGVEQQGDQTPASYSLKNYPNPFNSSTLLSFNLPHASNVELLIIDLNGRVVRALANETMAVGAHEIRWNGQNDFGEDVPSGVYLYKVRGDDFSASKKLLLVK